MLSRDAPNRSFYLHKIWDGPTGPAFSPSRTERTFTPHEQLCLSYPQHQVQSFTLQLLFQLRNR